MRRPSLPHILPVEDLKRELQAAPLSKPWQTEDWTALLKALRYTTSDKAYVLEAWRSIAPALQKLAPEMSTSLLVTTVWSMQSLYASSNDAAWQEQLLRAIADRAAQLQHTWRSDQISRCLIGLKNVGSDSPAVRRLLSVLAERAHACPSSFTAQDLANSIYGMAKMSSNHAEVRKMVEALIPKVRHVPDQLTGQGLGTALYGMQGMRGEHPEVGRLVTELTPLINASTAELNQQEIGNALYGLQNMTVQTPGVQSLLKVLARKIASSSAQLSPQAAGMAVYGLNRMPTSCPAVRDVLAALVPKLEQASTMQQQQQQQQQQHHYNEHALISMCFGFRNMRADVPEVRSLLRLVAQRLSTTSNLQLTAEGVFASIYGLRRMSAEYQEVKGLLTALTGHLEALPDTAWNPARVVATLTGVEEMTDAYPAVQRVLSLIASTTNSAWNADKNDWKAADLAEAFGSLYAKTGEHASTLQLLQQLTDQLRRPSVALTDLQFAQVLSGLQSMRTATKQLQGVRDLLAVLTKKLQDPFCALVHSEAVLGCLDGLRCLDNVPRGGIAEIGAFVQAFLHWLETSTVRLDAATLKRCLATLEEWSPRHALPVDRLSVLLMSVGNGGVPANGGDQFVSITSGKDIGDRLNALAGISTNLEVVRTYLEHLAEAISSATEVELDDADIAHALDGLAHLSDSSAEEEAVIGAIAAKIADSPATLTNASIAALAGMQHLTGKSDETLELLGAMMTKINQVPTSLDAEAVRRALSGLSSIVAHAPKTATAIADLLAQLQLTEQRLRLETVSCALSAVANAPTQHPAVRRLVKVLANLLRDAKGSLSDTTLPTIAAALGSMAMESDETMQLLDVLTTRLKMTEQRFSAEAIGESLRSLEALPKDSAEAQNLIRALSKKTRRMADVLGPRSIADAIFAMRKIGSESESSLKLIRTLADQTAKSNASFSGVDIGKSLFGLENMDTEHVEVRNLLAALAEKVKSAHTTMGAHSISTAVHGLQRLGSKRTEAKLLLYALAQQIDRSPAKLEGMDAAAAIYGLRDMDPSVKSVRALIRALASKLDHDTQHPFNKQELVTAIAGLRMLDDLYPEVRRLVAAILRHIPSADDLSAVEMEGYEFGTILSGLSSLNGTSSESQQLLLKLARIVGRCSVRDADTVTTQRVMVGIRRLNGSIGAVQALLDALLPKLNLANGPWNDRVAGDIISGLQNKGSEYPAIRQLAYAIAEKLIHEPVLWSAEAVETLVHGFHGVTHACEEFQYLLRVLSLQIFASFETLQPRTVWAAEAYLQHWTMAGVTEAQDFLLALRVKATKQPSESLKRLRLEDA